MTAITGLRSRRWRRIPQTGRLFGMDKHVTGLGTTNYSGGLSVVPAGQSDGMSVNNAPTMSPRKAAVLRRAQSAQCRQDHNGATDGPRRAASCRIRALMAARGLTATDVAVATGLKATSVQRWLYGRKAPAGDDLLAQLATVFRVDFAALLDSGEPCASQYIKATNAVLAHT